MTRLRKFLLALFTFLVMLLLLGGLLWRSGWMAEKLRARAIAEIERATGARATFGNFDWDWQRGVVRLKDITIHGNESADDPPFVQIAEAEITLKILSVVSPQVDLRAVRLRNPKIFIVTYSDGSTNLPRRRQRRPDEVIAELLKVGINRVDVEHGLFSWNHQEIPFAFHGDDLDLALTLEPDRYRGTVKGERLSLKLAGFRELLFTLASGVTLEKNGVQFENLQASLGGLRLEASGELRDWLNLALVAKVKANGPVRDLVSQFQVPLLPEGDAEATGELTYRNGWSFTGQVAGKNLAYRDQRVALRGVNVSGATHYTYSPRTGHNANVTKLRADSNRGSFRGSLAANPEKYRLRGTVRNVQFDDAQHVFDPSLPSWSSLVHGPIDVESAAGSMKVTAHLTLSPTDGERVLSGVVKLVYDSRARDVRLTDTHLESNSTKVDLAGTLLRGMEVDFTTTNPAELPFLNRLPIRIDNGGLLAFRGLVSGGMTAATAEGQLTAKLVTYQGERIEQLSARVNAKAGAFRLDRLEASRGNQSVTGNLEVSLFDWETRAASILLGRLSASGVEVTPYLKDGNGRIKGTADLSGLLQDPKLDGPIEWSDASYQGQALGNVSGRVTYTREQIEVRNGRLSLDRQPVEFFGTYVHEPNDWRNGAFQGSVKGSGMLLEKLSLFHDRFPLWSGRVEIDGRARGRLSDGQLNLNSLDGRAVVQQGAYEGKSLGALNIHAKTEAGLLNLTASGLLRGAAVTATSQWQLTGLMAGEGKFDLKGAKFDDFQTLVAASTTGQPPGEDASPFDLRLEASGTFRGNLRQPAGFQGILKISQVEMIPRQTMSDSARRDFTLRNDGPIEISYDSKGFDLKQARFFAKDTKLTATGLVTMNGPATANVRIVGDANLAILSALKADLLAAGNSSLDLTLRGSLTQPVMAGRMQLRDASFFLRDVPNGLDKINGVIFFDRSRARLENLTAQSGGGTIRLGGFIGFGGELNYQLQAQAENVRVRYPEGVSTAVNSNLTLAGSAARSLLSGSVTLLRAALNPRTDLGTLIADSSRASTTPTRIENEFLKNMQFDVRVDTALNAQVTTSLTQNVEAEVNLRLRGTPARPVLLGRTSFTQGEISFFGTKYTIDRGEVNFYNQTKIEPVINLDLQTRVRGVVVTINFSGPASKLNLSYRSDPPLQSSEILALLTVGRTPSGSVASGASVQSPTFLQGASSALLGQAVAAPITGRLQRLFGVSRVRIDPQLTGLENTAQARLTIEQQVSRDITVTFITNLNRTQQQIVSVEWDFSREFSALAIRDENGVFGLDFFYRKRFK